jgi:hypothetical protein
MGAFCLQIMALKGVFHLDFPLHPLSLTHSVLASKIGAALVRTHDYAKAINYFEAAVRNGKRASL